MSDVLNHRLKAALGLGIAWPKRTYEEIEDFLNSYEAAITRKVARSIRDRALAVGGENEAIFRQVAELIDPDKDNA